MGVYVKKSPLGYTALPTDVSISEAEYYCLPINDYTMLLKTQRERDQELTLLQTEVNQLRNTIKQENCLNRNLLRITRERANAARRITPKKAHDGYIVLSSQQRFEYYSVRIPEKGYEKQDRQWLMDNHHYQVLRKSTETWKSVIQTPYDASLPPDTIRNTIERDLLENVLKDIGCTNDGRNIGTPQVFINDDVNSLYNLSYTANYRSGLYEVVIYTTQPLVVPENRRQSLQRKKGKSSPKKEANTKKKVVELINAKQGDDDEDRFD